MAKTSEVDAWFVKKQHPLTAVMQRVRAIMLDADQRLDECIKWQTPTFHFLGNLASFNPNTKSHVSLMFHTGAKIPGKHPALIGGGDTARYVKFDDMAAAEALRGELEAIVRAWCEWREGGDGKAGAAKAKAKAGAKKPTKKTGAKKAATTSTSKKAAAKPKATKKAAGKTTASKAAAKKAARTR